MTRNDYLDSIDWQIYIERAGSIFMPSSAPPCYGPFMKKQIGTSFTHQLYYYNGKTVTYYRSGKEMEKILRVLAKLMDEGKISHYIEKEAEMGELFNRAQDMTSKELFNYYVKATFYNTIIPYLLVDSEKYMKNKNKKDLEKFKKIREVSYYPDLLEIIKKRYSDKIAEQLGANKEELKHISFLEMKKIVFGQEVNVNREELQLRNKPFYAYWCEEKQDFLFHYGEVAGLKHKKYDKINEFSGTVAYAGKARGKVKIVNESKDMINFEKGDVLVTINSNPSLMPVLEKATAIVSDEGGINCHASIISRELKTPCIVGTKIATKVLVDGDLVEVDAESGIVRKI